MTIDQLISQDHARSILEISDELMLELIGLKILKPTIQPNGNYRYSINSVIEYFNSVIDKPYPLDIHTIRMIYSLSIEGTSIQDLVKYMKLQGQETQLLDSLVRYHHERKRQLTVDYGINSQDVGSFITPMEFRARMRVNKRNVPLALIDSGDLDGKDVKYSGKPAKLITFKSYLSYLDKRNWRGQILYTSEEVSDILKTQHEIDITPRNVCRRAINYGIRKLRDITKSIYLFTEEDIGKFAIKK